MAYGKVEELSGVTNLMSGPGDKIFSIEENTDTYLGEYTHFYNVKAFSQEDAISCINKGVPSPDVWYNLLGVDKIPV